MSQNGRYRCPVEATIDVIGGKWKPIVLWALRNGTLRYGEIAEAMPGVTQKMLTRQLRELEKDGIISRKVFAQVPPKVEYTLTDSGNSLMPIIDLLCVWGQEHKGDLIDYD